jgi:hypothetical protein
MVGDGSASRSPVAADDELTGTLQVVLEREFV